MAVLAAWAFPSSAGATTYETTLETDGTLSCNCPGFIFKKKGQVRGCKHTRQITPFVNSILDGFITAQEVAERLGLTGGFSAPLPLATASTIPKKPAAPASLQPERKGRLIDFEE